MGDTKETHVTGKEEIILQLLANGGEMYGLEMAKKSQGLLARGSIYVLLDRLEDKGMIESWHEDKDPAASGLPRRLYRIKGEGSRALRSLQRKRAALVGQFARA